MSYRSLLPALLVAASPLPGVAQDEATSLKQALAKGDGAVTFRYRFETVSEDTFDQEANASTLRTTVGYRTKPYHGFSLFIEAEDLRDVGTDGQYNNRGAGGLANGVTDRPVIADPEGTDLNQAHLTFERGKTRLDLGRRELELGDLRFVGAVGWRQNHQSFDAFAVTNSSLGTVRFFYGFVDNVNNVFGGNKRMASHLFNAAVELGIGELTSYAYLLDYDRPLDFALSTQSYGLELAGERPLGSSKILYELEYATQSDFGENPNRVDAGYLHAMLGAGFGVASLSLRAGYELLEGRPGNGAFQTPLATLHKFNGWADKFLVTPPAGLADLYLHLGGSSGPVAWMVVVHDFSADSSSIDYGTELDAQLTYRTPWEQLFGLKAAAYDADRFSTDTSKAWFWTAYRF